MILVFLFCVNVSPCILIVRFLFNITPRQVNIIHFDESMSYRYDQIEKYWQKIHSVAEPRVVLFKSHCDDKTKFGCCRWIRYRNKWRRKEPECGLKCISRQNYLHELLSGRIAADSAILVLAGEINIGFQITKNGMKRKLAITD